MSEPRKDFGIQGLDEEDGYRTPGQGLADGHGQAKQPEHLTRCEHPGYTNPRVTHDERPLELADGGIGDTLTDESSSHRCGGVSGVGAEGIGNEVRRRADDEHGHYDIEKEQGDAKQGVVDGPCLPLCALRQQPGGEEQQRQEGEDGDAGQVGGEDHRSGVG